MEINEKMSRVIKLLTNDEEHEKWQTDPIKFLEEHSINIKGIDKLNSEQKEQVKTALREIKVPTEEGLTWIPCPVCKGLLIGTCGVIIVATILAIILTDGIAAAAEDVAVEGALEVVAAETGLTTARIWKIIVEAWSKTGPVQFLGVVIAGLCEAMGDC